LVSDPANHDETEGEGMSGSEWGFYVEKLGAGRQQSREVCYGKFGIADFIEGRNMPNSARGTLRRRIARSLGVEARQVYLSEKLEIILVVEHWPDDVAALAAAAWRVHNVQTAAAMCIADEAISQARESSRIVDQMMRIWESGAPC
jgi:hypothetical protein